MINIVFGGGLGNQMFQYAFLYVCLSELDANSIMGIMHRNANGDYRDFALEHFDITARINIKDEQDVRAYYKWNVFKRKVLHNLLKKTGLKNDKIVKIMSKLGIVFTPEIYGYYDGLKLKENMYIEGAFQNWRYFDKHKKELQREFNIKGDIPVLCQNIIDKISSSNSVCVHVRRGDYLEPYYAAKLAVCDGTYYKTAIDIINECVDSPEFFVFTNTHEDHVWIQNNYEFKGNVHYVDLNNPDYLELYMMSKCKHFIISNSTFSWWAQYLSAYEEKVVVAPSIWYRGNDTSREIYLPDWKLVDVT